MEQRRARKLRKTTFSALVMLMIAACASSSGSAGSGPALVGQNWVAEEISRRGVLDNVQSTMSIDATGRATGLGGCNSYGGPARINGDAIRFGPLATTRMACTPAVGDQEQRFFAALASATRFGFTPEGKLVLYDANGAVVVTFGRLIGQQQP